MRISMLRPILAFGAAGAGVHFEEGVVGIGLAGEQGFEFAPRDVGSQFLQRRFGVGDGLFVFFGFTELDHGELVVELALHAADGLEPVLERVALAHHALGARLIAPEGGVFGFLVQLGETALRGIDVKDASSAATSTA